jgi:hypothetical protein
VSIKSYPCDRANVSRLIAIMLGRLEMDVDECIAAYIELMKDVFEDKARSIPIGPTGKIKARFDSNKLKNAIEEVMNRKDIDKADLLNDSNTRGCRV